MKLCDIRVLPALLCTITLLAAPLTARAGFFEIGASASYRHSNVDVDAYDDSSSLTGSIGYYLTEATAFELSYTQGADKRAVSENAPNAHITSMFYTTAGFDFIYTFGDKDSSFRPYVKVGVNDIIQKRIVDQYRDANGNLYEANPYDDTPGLVPSAGLGFRIGLTDSLFVKLGVDTWTSRPTSVAPITFDYIGRAGLSIIF
jgi:outer membrane protein W